MGVRWRSTSFESLIGQGVLEIGDGYRAKNSELGGLGPIFMRAGQMREGYFDFEGVDRFREGTSQKLAAKSARAGDTVVTTKGNSVGRTAFVQEGHPEFVYSPHLSYWRSLDHSRLLPQFLRYWALSTQFEAQLNALSASTDMAPYLSLRDQRVLEISLPGAVSQRNIARILGILDDKIELNRRMSETLESMVRAIFQSWFVDFDPVREKMDGVDSSFSKRIADLFPGSLAGSELGGIPRGWQVGNLESCAILKKRPVAGDAIDPLAPYLSLGHMPRRSIRLNEWGLGQEVSSTKYSFKKREVLFGRLRPYFHKVVVAPVDGVCSTDVLVLAPSHPDWFGFVLGHFSSDALIAHATAVSSGTRMPRVKWEDLGSYRVPVPPVPVAAAFASLVEPLVSRLLQQIEEDQLLRATRDTLLPKLISGALRIPEAERLVEEAT